jgi:cytoskeletal protein CcmA (bactofilin family)
MKKRKGLTLFIISGAIFTTILLYGAVGTARAVEIVNGNTISAGEVIDDDVFIGGDFVTIDGTVNGDLFAAGNTVTINGVINGSLVTAAQTIQINGEVSGSVYAASSSMVIGESTTIGRNLYYGGFGLETKPGSQIGRDLLVGGYQAILAGTIQRDVVAALGALHLNGEVGRNVRVEVGEPGSTATGMPSFFMPPGAPSMTAPGLYVGKEAKIGGQLTYISPVKQDNAVQVEPLGGIVYQTPQPRQEAGKKPGTPVEVPVGRWILNRLRGLATLLVLGGLALWIIPGYLTKWVDKLKSEPLPSAGWGFITMIVGYAGAVLLALSIIALALFLGAITLGGLARTVFGLGFTSLGFAFTIFSLCVSYGSKLIVAYLVGRLVMQKFAPQSAEKKFWSLLVGVVIYVIIRSIPILGWLVGVIVTLFGLGAIWLGLRQGKGLPEAVNV